ncbi:MAG: hypothetical protein ABSE48_13490 [Verrucomicrobiota bacterium]|jgi:hypothetical protein
MKSVALKNGMVIFLEQIAFIHVQPSLPKEGRSAPEIHIHFPAALTGPKGSRSMRAVVGREYCQDFMDQLETQGVDSSHMRRCVSDLEN